MGLMQLLVRLGLDATSYESGLKRAQSSARSFGSTLSSEVGGKIASVFGAAAIAEGIRHTIEYGGQIQDLANRLGISTTAVQQWDYALKQNGSSIEAASKFFEKLVVSRAKALEGNGDALNAFRQLGISPGQLKGQRVEGIAAAIAEAFKTGDPQALIAPLREVGGKSAGELVSAFRDGLSDALKEAPLISPEDVASLDRAGDALGKLKAEAMSSFAPGVAALADGALAMLDAAKMVLAVPVGALKGIVDSFPGLNHPLDIVKWWAGGNLKAGYEGAKEAVDAVS